MQATPDERTWGMIAHLSALVGAIVPFAGSILAPLIVWRTRGEHSSFVAGQAKEALNFNITVAIAALVWVLVALFVLVMPAEAFVPDLIVVGLILVGGLFFLGLLISNREALETEPGDVDVFKH